MESNVQKAVSDLEPSTAGWFDGPVSDLEQPAPVLEGSEVGAPDVHLGG